jgi:hypothetical protein
MFVAVALTACRSSVEDFEMTTFLKLHALFVRTAAAPRSEFTVRDDGMIPVGAETSISAFSVSAYA